jgi:hypothetical protein
MSRCKSCNNLLDDFELSSKDSTTGEYITECFSCMESLESSCDDFTPFIDDDVSLDVDYPQHNYYEE